MGHETEVLNCLEESRITPLGGVHQTVKGRRGGVIMNRRQWHIHLLKYFQQQSYTVRCAFVVVVDNDIAGGLEPILKTGDKRDRLENCGINPGDKW